MGMRAVFAYQRDNTVHVTTVQWSTDVFQTLRIAIPARMEETGQSFDAVAREVFSAIVSHEHISAVDVLSVEDRKDDYYASRAGIIFPFDTEGTALCVVGPQGSPDEHGVFTGDAEGVVKNHPHAQDGISAWYVEGSGKVEFYIDPRYVIDPETGQVDVYIVAQDLLPLTAEG